MPDCIGRIVNRTPSITVRDASTAVLMPMRAGRDPRHISEAIPQHAEAMKRSAAA